jgi:anti-sigma regulatory factor (Ser/Thr protein kinase)
MAGYDVSEPLLRCVLPFEAEPREIRLLRKAAMAQLDRWSVSEGIGEAAQLVASELATNVLRHVGAGAPGVLILEAASGVLRLEMHDKSHDVPSRAAVEGEAECGRGLHLLAHLADDWGTVITASGKVVWCTLGDGRSGSPAPLQRASAALEGYAEERPVWTRCRGARSSAALLQDSAVALIADLLHWSVANGGSPEDVLDWAQSRFEAEAGVW